MAKRGVVLSVLSILIVLGLWSTQPVAAKGVPSTIVFQRVAEPKENAFTMLVPKGWLMEGGIYRIDPSRAGGPGNSVEAKCDIAVKSDRNGTVMLRCLPKINYADGPIVPPTHGPGSNYNGMTVVRMPNVEGFLGYTFKQVHPGARDVKVVRKESLPKLVAAVARAAAPLNSQLAQAGVRPMTFHAGFMIFEYTEGGARYRELLYTVLIDARASMAAWSNDFTTLMRAPAGEADAWKPVLDIVSNSVQFNPQWVAGEMKGQGQRADTARKVLEDMNRIDREIVAHRDRTRKEIQTDQYLTLTGKNDYKNPFTGKVECDTSDWKMRWVNSSGEYIYSNDTLYDPTRDPEERRKDWKLTKPVR